MRAGVLAASHLNTAMLCELGERAYAHWWLCSAPDTEAYIRAWWPC